MSNEDTENKCQECDDPCDDCTDYDIANLTGWIAREKNKKEVDKTKK